MRDRLFPLLKNSKSGVDDRGHRFRSESPLTNYPHAPPYGQLKVDRKRLYEYKWGIFGGFRHDALKIDMSVDEDIEC